MPVHVLLSGRAPVLAAATNPSDTVWIFVACALVLLMTPALAFFYGGLVRSKNALNTMMMSFAALGVVGVVWVLAGYSLAFAPGNSWIGGLDFLALGGVGLEAKGSIPHLLFMMFQGTFAIITAALVSGAVVERMRFVPFLAFMALWTVVVYSPICHWVWGGGWLAQLGALDFAGGTVVHISAGAAAVSAAWILGPRKDRGRQALLPHNVPFVLLGAALLWFGWLGFNGGSALGANKTAALAFVNTILAPMGTIVVWTLLDLRRTGRVTAVGIATGIVVGLVAVTPAAGFISPLRALGLGAFAALPSYFAILLVGRLRLDDSLDVAAAHGVGGVVGAMATGVLAQSAWGGVNGALAGNPRQLWIQAVGVLAAMLYSGVMTLALLAGIRAVAAIRADDRRQGVGLDVWEHGEEAYSSGEGAILVLPQASARASERSRVSPAVVEGRAGGGA